MKLLRVPALLALLATSLAPAAPAAALLTQPWAFFADPVWTIDGDEPGAYCYSDQSQLRIGFGGSLSVYRRVHINLPGGENRLYEPWMTWTGSGHSENGAYYWRGGRFVQEWRNDSTTATANPLPRPVSGEFPNPQVLEVTVEEQGEIAQARPIQTRTFTLHKIPAGLESDKLLLQLNALGCTRQARLLAEPA